MLMMEGLQKDSRLDVGHGADGRRLAVLRTVLRDRPDVLHFDWIQGYFLHPTNLIAWPQSLVFVAEMFLVRLVFCRTIVWSLHNIVAHTSAKPRRVDLWTRRAFARVCSKIRVFDISTVSRAASALGVEEDRFVVCPEGSYIGFYPDDELSQAEARRTLNVELDAVVLLYVGFIRQYKGLDRLVRTFKAVKHPRWRLIIAGNPKPRDAEFAENVAQLARDDDRIRLDLRFIDEDELQYYFRAADVVVLPFRNIENSGSANLAMGFSKAIIAPNKGNLPRRLQHQAKLLYDNDLNEAFDALADCDRGLLEHFGRENRCFAERLNWTDFAAELIAVHLGRGKRKTRTEPDGTKPTVAQVTHS